MKLTPPTAPRKKAGRPAVPESLRKKNRAISLTDAEYARLELLAERAGTAGPSAYLVRHLRLGEPLTGAD